MTTDNSSAIPDLDFNTASAKRSRKFRALKDKIASSLIGFGGISVIIAILLIFFYLLYEVQPLFNSAKIHQWQDNEQAVEAYPAPGEGETLYLTLEEQAEIGLRVTDLGQMNFFNSRTGAMMKQVQADIPAGASVTSFALASESSRIFALGLSNGQALVFKHEYKSEYPDGKRVITPSVSYPLGEAPIDVADTSLDLLAINGEESDFLLVGGGKNDLNAAALTLSESLFGDEVEIETDNQHLPELNIDATKVLLMPDRRWILIAGNNGKVAVLDLRNSEGPAVSQLLDATDGSITTFDLLLGGNALLLGNDLGKVSQWFLVRDDQNLWQLTKIREFEGADAPLVDLTTEHRRKGFATVDTDNTLRIYNSTAHRTALSEKLSDKPIDMIAFAPRANALLTEQDNMLTLYKIENEHPDVSWSALWEEVWYEGYDEPKYIWQSSAANNDFEPKYSLMPLAFGTLKAAFYAMLLATPLAICGAIYTAYFMVPTLRRKVKPFIELMEALPTVILGFLAGLWLAPFMEDNLPGIFTCLIIVPLAVVAFGFSWAQLPQKIRFMIPDGWDALLLIPVIILTTLFGLSVSSGVESILFGGDMRAWITDDLGISYDQRNALVVGIAMGFAVIPTIFSITEDAIFAVPKHLSFGSLALGASPWQTLTRVVLPTASPGIFSAVMIGMGRAVGETMIVLMATGNTPIMDMNIFEGMRTLAANIAVEMPESEVGSSHYRILFLAAFVLFLFTFAVNTLAELVRQSLRKKYGSL